MIAVPANEYDQCYSVYLFVCLVVAVITLVRVRIVICKLRCGYWSKVLVQINTRTKIEVEKGHGSSETYALVVL